MEPFLLIIGLFFLVTIFMPWVNMSRFGSVRDDIERLQNRIRDLEDRLYGGESAIKPSKTSAFSQKPEMMRGQLNPDVLDTNKEWDGRAPKIEEETIKNDVQEYIRSQTPIASVPRVEKTDWVEKAQNTFEQNIATKLPVWIGSVSLIFAAFFLVKYSIEFGLLGPLARVSIGGLFGVGLLAAGQYISKKPKIANALLISQGLIGAGIVALYVSLYAAINLYALMPPVIGFGGMGIVTALAVVLSLRHGQPIAVFGLLGGLLTPALVGSDEPNAVALFTYLFLMFSGMFVVMIRKGWWVLSIFALLGVFGWSALWFTLTFSSADASVLVLFAIALSAVVLVATGKRIADDTLCDDEQYTVHCLNAVAIAGGVLTIVWLSFEMTLTLFDWSMLGLLSVALIALSYFKQDIYQKPLLMKLGASLILFFFWAQNVSLTEALAVIVGISVIYIGGSALMMRRVSDPRLWSVIQAATALSLYLTSYWVLDLPAWMEQSQGGFGGMFWGILSLILASLSIYQVSDIRAKYKADDTIQTHLVAVYSLAASAFISLGLAIELPWAYLPMAIAGQIAATAFMYQRTGISFLKYIMYILTLVFVAMNYEQALLFGNIIMQSLAGETPSMRLIGDWMLDAPLMMLGVPSLLMYLSLSIVMRIDKTDQKLIHALFGTANILALFTAYYVLRDFFHTGSGHIFSSEIGFIERGFITMLLAAVGIGIIEFIRKHNVEFLKPWGAGIFRMAMVRFVYFDFFLYNPYWSNDQFVGNMPILNGVTMTYGLGLLAVGWAMQNKDVITKTDWMRNLYGVIGLACVFALTSLNVRQYFHGGFLANGEIGSTELYAYSLIWLLTGLALLTAGIKLQNKTVRMASVAFIGLAVCKVFLFDAAELEGLYRVFSFLGLGVSLIGLSYFYTRFVFGDKKRAE